MATSLKPRFSKREMMGPMRPRWRVSVVGLKVLRKGGWRLSAVGERDRRA